MTAMQFADEKEFQVAKAACLRAPKRYCPPPLTRQLWDDEREHTIPEHIENRYWGNLKRILENRRIVVQATRVAGQFLGLDLVALANPAPPITPLCNLELLALAELASDIGPHPAQGLLGGDVSFCKYRTAWIHVLNAGIPLDKIRQAYDHVYVHFKTTASRS